MNCLEFFVREWEKDPSVNALYNGDHIIVFGQKFYDENKIYEVSNQSILSEYVNIEGSLYLPVTDYSLKHFSKFPVSPIILLKFGEYYGKELMKQCIYDNDDLWG